MSKAPPNPNRERETWHVYYLNDCDWWVARSMDEAQAHYLKFTGCSADEAFDDPYELDDEMLGRLKFVEDRDLPRSQWVRRTFREELDRRVAAGLAEPEMFACTEY